MSVRWIEQGGGRFVAVDGVYRLRIMPEGLAFQVVLFEGIASLGAKCWGVRGRQRTGSLALAKAAGADMLTDAKRLDELNAHGRLAAAQGGL